MSKENIITTLRGKVNNVLNIDYQFLTIDPAQSKGRAFLRAARYNEGDLDDVYVSPSAAKREAWRDCEKMAARLGATNLRITGHSCTQFSVAMDICVDGRPAIIYRTKTYDYLIYNEETNQ